jgi:hypothetical protein
MSPVAPLIRTLICFSLVIDVSMVTTEAARRNEPCHARACSHAPLTRTFSRAEFARTYAAGR